MAKLQLSDKTKSEHHQQQLKAAILSSLHTGTFPNEVPEVIAEVGAQTQAQPSSILQRVKQFKPSRQVWGQQWKSG